MASLFRVIVPVGNIDNAQQFYSTLLNQPGQRVSPGRHYFDCEGVILACFDPRADGDLYDANPLPEPLYIAVDDLKSTYRAAVAANANFPGDDIPGVGMLGEIAERPWGELSFYVSDPFDNPLCFVSRDSALRG